VKQASGDSQAKAIVLICEGKTFMAGADITEPLSEDAVLKLERQAFMALVRHPATLARIEHMLETGKPLRN
jgi:3-hydroxyacyl-CoA dehydrogenase